MILIAHTKSDLNPAFGEEIKDLVSKSLKKDSAKPESSTTEVSWNGMLAASHKLVQSFSGFYLQSNFESIRPTKNIHTWVWWLGDIDVPTT